MKKLHECDRATIDELYTNNQEFRNLIDSSAYDMAMEAQADEANCMGCKVFDWHDHYTSFYLSTPRIYGAKAPELVAHHLEADYMTEDNAKIYDKLNKTITKWENMTTDEQETEAGEKLYNEAIKLCDELADGLTAQLRAYEDIDTDYVYEELHYQCSEGAFADYETDGTKVYQYITKVYK